MTQPIRRVTLFRVKPDAPPARVAALQELIRALPSHLPAIARVGVGPARTNTVADAWTHMWDMEFSAGGADAYTSDPWVDANLRELLDPAVGSSLVDRVEFVDFQTVSSGSRPDLPSAPVRRATLIRMSDTATREQIERTEALIAEMPQQIPNIKAWALGRSVGNGATPWTHVRDHELDDEAAVEAYSKHPFHADVVVPHFREMSRVGAIARVSIGWYRAPESFVQPSRVRA